MHLLEASGLSSEEFAKVKAVVSLRDDLIGRAGRTKMVILPASLRQRTLALTNTVSPRHSTCRSAA
jgi:hypothetical protein